MKKRLLVSLSLLVFSVNSSAQVVDYFIPVTDLINMTVQTGDMCIDPGEYKQTSVGNTWGFQWMSTNGGTPTSINVDWINVSDEGVLVTTTLNGFANNSFNSTANASCLTAGELFALNPANYNPLGLNTILMDYSAATTFVTQLYPFLGTIYAHVEVTYGAACTEPDVPTLTASSPICPGASSTINITGNLNDATGWVVYTGSCGGTIDGGTVTSTYIATPASTTTYYIRGEGGCATPGACGSVTITVDDSQAPVPDLGSLPDVNAECSATPTAPTATDNCAGAVTGTPDVGFPINTQGTTVVTWTYDDGNGNTSTQTQNVVLNDVTSPTIVCPANISVSNTLATCGAVVTWTAPTTFDNCGSVTTTSTHNSGDTFPVGTTNVTYTVTDGAGNSANCMFSVTVNDIQAPTIICPPDIVQNNDPGLCGANVIYGTPVGVDNCPGSTTTLIAGLPSGTVFPVGSTTVMYEVVDASGNASQCSFITTINDTESPNIVCPTNIVQNNDLGICGATVNYITPVGVDNCPGSTTTLVAGLGPGSIFPIGTTNVTYEVVDASGNTAQCSFITTVNDTEAPTITCPSDIIVANDLGLCEAVVNYILPVGVDNCPASTTSLTGGFSSGSSFPVGVTTVTYEVIDASSNSAQCSFDVTVNDAEFPTISCPSDITTSNDVGICGAIVSYTAPIGTDNCPGPSTSLFSGLSSGSTFPVGTNTVTYEVVDAASNSTQCSFDITVNDTEVPVPDNAALSDVNGECSATPIAPTATDNCAGSVTGTPDVGFPVITQGTTVVTWTYDDGNGNMTTQTQSVILNDVTAPVPDNGTLADFNAECSATPPAPTATDNCVGTVTATPDVIFPITTQGTTVVTWTYDDGNGNTTTQTQNVVLDDVTAPIISQCPGSSTFPADNAGCTAQIVWLTPIATDNCGPVTMTSTHNSGDTFPLGTTTVTYTATDAVGNTSTCVFDITIISDLTAVTVVTDLACNGDSSGDIDVTVSGTGSPYSFDWNSGTFTTEDLTGIPAGVYNLTITDAFGCTTSLSETVTEPTVLNISLDAIVDPSGCGLSDGSVDVTVTGGTPTYAYDWNSGTYSTEDISAIPAGVYNLVVTDGNGCTAISNATLSDPGAPIIAVDTIVDATCFGDMDGEINVTVTGGTSPYTYDWDNDGTGDNDDNEDLTGIGAGTYALVVTDAGGCSSSINGTVNEPAALDTSVTQSGFDLTSNATGVSYQWIDCSTMNPIVGDTNATFTATANGDYAVIITDAPCSDTSACYTIEGIGFDENISSIKVYPNPGAGIFNLDVQGISGLTSIQVFDLGGKEILNNYYDFISDQIISLDLSTFERGTYLLRVSNSAGISSTLLILK